MVSSITSHIALSLMLQLCYLDVCMYTWKTAVWNVRPFFSVYYVLMCPALSVHRHFFHGRITCHYFIHRWERKIRSTLNPSWRRWDLLVSSLYLSLSNCSSISVWHCWGHVADTAVLTILVSCICLSCLHSDSLCDTCFHSPAFLTRLQCYHFTSIRNWLQLSLWNVHDRSAWHWHKIFHVAAPCNRVRGEVCYAACYCYL